MRLFPNLFKLGCVLSVLNFGGCAATQAALQISKANKAVERAKENGAIEYAVYEYTMAENYLEKAREEAGYSDFKDSVTLANGAAEWADKAIIVIKKEGRGLDLDSLPGETQTLTDEDRAQRVPEESSEPTPGDDDAPAERANDEEVSPPSSKEATPMPSEDGKTPEPTESVEEKSSPENTPMDVEGELQ